MHPSRSAFALHARLLNSAGIALAFVQPWLSCALYVLVALARLVPDRRIESRIDGQ